MKSSCPKCMADYFEVFDDGGAHCFSCGHHESGGSFTPGLKQPRFEMQFTKSTLLEADYSRLLTQWGISKQQADYYGLIIAESDKTRWLYIPILDDRGKEIHFQLRAWNGFCQGPKYRMPAGPPPPGLVWKSDALGGKRHIAVVEGVLDGIRVGEVLPTVACFGTELNEERIKTILGLGTPDSIYHIMFDPDVPRLALKAQRDIGMLRSRIVRLPAGKDPTDLTREELEALIFHEEESGC